MPATLSRRLVARHAAEQLVAGDDVTKLAEQLVAYLAESKRLGQVDFLIRDIELVLAQEYGRVTIHLTSARELSDTLKELVTKQITSASGASEAMIADATVDSSLIAGIIARTPTSTFDSSVKTRLKQLRSIA